MKILPSLLSFIKAHPFFSALIGLFIILIVPFFFLVGGGDNNTPPPPDIRLVTPVPLQSTFEDSIFNPVFNDPLPTSATIYTLTIAPLTTSQMTKIADNFGMSSEPQLLGGDYYWTTTERLPILQIDPQNGYVSYIGADLSSEEDFVTAPDQLTQTALQIIQEKGVETSNLNTTSPFIQYMEEWSEQPRFVQDFNLADVFLVSFSQQINDVKIYRQYGQTSNVTVVFDRRGSIKQLSYYVINAAPNPLSQVELITVDELKKTITDGRGIVRQPFSSNTSTGEDLQGLVFTLSHAELGYIVDPMANVLQPIFVATGTVQKVGFPTREGVLYVPATK